MKLPRDLVQAAWTELNDCYSHAEVLSWNTEYLAIASILKACKSHHSVSVDHLSKRLEAEVGALAFEEVVATCNAMPGNGRNESHSRHQVGI